MGLGTTVTGGGGEDDALAVTVGATGAAEAEAGAVGGGSGSRIAPAEDEVASVVGSWVTGSVRLHATGSKAPNTSTPAAIRCRESVEDAPQNGQ